MASGKEVSYTTCRFPFNAGWWECKITTKRKTYESFAVYYCLTYVWVVKFNGDAHPGRTWDELIALDLVDSAAKDAHPFYISGLDLDEGCKGTYVLQNEVSDALVRYICMDDHILEQVCGIIPVSQYRMLLMHNMYTLRP